MKKLIILIIFSLSTLTFACEPVTKSLAIIDPVDGAEFTVAIKRYHPKTSEKVPAVFILPPIVGETVLDRQLAARFCSNGMSGLILNVVKVNSTEEEISNLYVHDNSYVRALAGVRAVISDLEKDPSILSRYGILGMSLGGMLAAYVAGSEPRILASVIVVGAGYVPGVLAYSDQEVAKAQREARMKKFGLTTAVEYENLLKNLVPNDPLYVMKNVRPESMYMFIANSDTTVPTKYQRLLRDAVTDPLVYEMRGNHFNGIIKAGTVHAGKITNFLKNRLQD